MSRFLVPLILFFAAFLVAIPTASAVTMAWSQVGSPGNASDTNDGDDETPGIQHFGAVDHVYAISTYDVTVSQYVEFLNAKVPSGNDPLALYNSSMGGPYGGIKFTAAAPTGTKYSAIPGRENHPANWVSWLDAVRFANWMNNGQGNGSTETGAYTLQGGTAIPSNYKTITRSPSATIVLPSEDEWYKAAYYNPATNSYYLHPTSSNSAPIGSAPTAVPNRANISPGGPNDLTDVGAYSGTTSPIGALDMAGNVVQYNETTFVNALGQVSHGIRGQPFNVAPGSGTQSSIRPSDAGVDEFMIGFRLVMVPEPSTGVLAALALGFIWAFRKRLTNR